MRMHLKEKRGLNEVPDGSEYEVVKEKNDTEECVYHVLEDSSEGARNETTYEMPIQSKSEDSRGKAGHTAYSTLQYHNITS